MKIEQLTPEQEAAIPAFRQHYLDIACGGSRIDRNALGKALADAYSLIGKPPPKLLVFDSPAAWLRTLKAFESAYTGELQREFGNLLTNQLDWSMNQRWHRWRTGLSDRIHDELTHWLVDQLYDQLENQLRGQLVSEGLLIELPGFEFTYDFESSYHPNYLIGSQGLSRIAWARFAQHFGANLDEETAYRLDIMERIATQCEWWWPYEHVVIASERPTMVRWDDQGRLDAKGGPAVEYADGYRLYPKHSEQA